MRYVLEEEKLAEPGDLIQKTIGTSAGELGLVVDVIHKKNAVFYSVVAACNKLRRPREWIYFFTKIIARAPRTKSNKNTAPDHEKLSL